MNWSPEKLCSSLGAVCKEEGNLSMGGGRAGREHLSDSSKGFSMELILYTSQFITGVESSAILRVTLLLWSYLWAEGAALWVTALAF